MDEMSLASIPLCEKSKAPAAKTTMSVREMQHLLGLGKTESYWLIHKNFFEVIQINDKMRVVISSFEKWYANQIKYHKVNGPPPGEELRKRSYSVVEAAEILSVDTETIYTLIRRVQVQWPWSSHQRWMPTHQNGSALSVAGFCTGGSASGYTSRSCCC